jgi:hypothetical protein
MGSFVVALAGAVDPRLDACVVAAGGGLHIPRGEYKPAKSKPSRVQGLPDRSLAFLGDVPAILYALHASRGPTLIVNGTLDWDGNPRKKGQGMDLFGDMRARTIALRGTPDRVFDIGAFQPGAIHRPYFVTKDVALWLERHIDFPNWSAADIQAMPETYIRDWARDEHVEIDPGYTTEGLESGTHALGQGIPGISEQQLNVFSLEEWRRMKDRLTLDAWSNTPRP